VGLGLLDVIPGENNFTDQQIVIGLRF